MLTDDEYNSGDSMYRDIDPGGDPQQLRRLGRGGHGSGALWGDASHVGNDQSRSEENQAPLYRKMSCWSCEQGEERTYVDCGYRELDWQGDQEEGALDGTKGWRWISLIS